MLGSLELPIEGELILGDGANMVLDHVTQEDCQGRIHLNIIGGITYFPS